MSQDTSIAGQNSGPAPTAQQGNGLAIAGLVCGLVGLLVFSVILGPLAIILGGVGISKANRGAPHKGMAIAAVVLGIIDLVVAIILLVAIADGGSFSYNVG